MMFQATRHCFHHLICRRLFASSASSASLARLPWSAGTTSSSTSPAVSAAVSHRIYPSIHTACFHTHQRLQQDSTGSTTASGSGDLPESPGVVGSEEQTHASISVEDLGLG